MNKNANPNLLALALSLPLMGMVDVLDFPPPFLAQQPERAPLFQKKPEIKRVPNLITELEFSLSKFSHLCPPPLLKILLRITEDNRAFAVFSQQELDLLLGAKFARIAVSNRIVQRAFSEFIDPSSNADSIHAWLSSNPLLGPSERRFLTVAILIYEREVAADLAKMSKTLSRAREVLGETDPFSVQGIKEEYERATRDWEFTALLLANIIGFPGDFDPMTRIAASELYRDRVGNLEIALITKDWTLAREILLSSVKNNLVMNAPEHLKALADRIKSIDIQAATLEDITFIKESSHKLLLSTRYELAHQFIPKLMEADVSQELKEQVKKNLVLRLQGAYRAHYFRDNDLKVLELQFSDEKKLLAILKQPSFDETDRARVRFYLLQWLERTSSMEMRQRIIIFIFRLYALPTLRSRTRVTRE